MKERGTSIPFFLPKYNLLLVARFGATVAERKADLLKVCQFLN